MPINGKYQLKQFCSNDNATAKRLENYLLNVGLNIKIFGKPLGIVYNQEKSKVEKNSTNTEDEEPDYDELAYYLRN